MVVPGMASGVRQQLRVIRHIRDDQSFRHPASQNLRDDVIMIRTDAATHRVTNHDFANKIALGRRA